ncbi:unnamed protein product, partial [Iphiclides podalirius]
MQNIPTGAAHKRRHSPRTKRRVTAKLDSNHECESHSEPSVNDPLGYIRSSAFSGRYAIVTIAAATRPKCSSAFASADR